MATTKNKSTKAKTKTSKKAASKSTKATKAVKTTNKTVVAKAVPAKKSSSKRSITEQLRMLNIVSGAVAVLLAGVAGVLMNSTSFQLFTGLLTKDELTSTTTTVFTPAIRAVYDLELRWAVVGILLLSAIIPLLAATRNRKQYEASLASKVMLWRWIDMAVISALMVQVIALISGVQDIMTLKLIGALMVITAVLSWFSEKQNAGSAKPSWRNYNLSLVTATLPWLLIAAYAVGTVIHGQVRSPWYVYALYASTLTVFLGYAMNGMRQLKAQQDYEVTERNNVQLGILVKVAFAVILIIGLYKK